MGFPKNNLYSRAFNSAIQKAIDNGTISELEKEYNTSSDDFPCEESSQGGTDEIVVTMVTGVIIFSVLFLLIGTIQALVGKSCTSTENLVSFIMMKFAVTARNIACK